MSGIRLRVIPHLFSAHPCGSVCSPSKSPREAIVPTLESCLGPAVVITPQTLLNVTGNVRVNLQLRRNAPACR
jgi:hypothetical protein